MKLEDYIRKNNIEESVAKALKKEFKAMCLIEIEKYSYEVQKKMKKRAEELTINKLLDDFFYEVGEEGKLYEMSVSYGLVPNYINMMKYGKQFILRKTDKGVLGCFYRVS